MSTALKSTGLFNVEETTGADLESSRTTAAIAGIEAPTSAASQEIQSNAEILQSAAEKAAQAAQTIGPNLTGEDAATRLQDDLARKTDAAVAEGQQNVQTYIGAASNMATSAVNTAASYIPTSVVNSQAAQTLSNATNAAVQTVQGYAAAAQPHIANAQAAIQPHLETVQATIQPHINNAQAAIQPHLNNAQATVQPHLDRVVGLGQSLVGNTKATTADGADASKGSGKV